MMSVQFDLQVPRAFPTIEPEQLQAGLRMAAAAAMRDCVRNFERQGYEEPPGVFHRWPPLSPTTLKIAEGQAMQKVGGRKGKARIRKQQTPYGALPIAYGEGGEQKTARVRRFAGAVILVDTGRLRASLLSGPNHIERSGRAEIEVGTNVEYAVYHERGAKIRVTKKMKYFLGLSYGVWLREGTELAVPPRPFLRVSRQGLDQMKQAIVSAITARTLR
jgi:phage gpG-like protein